MKKTAKQLVETANLLHAEARAKNKFTNDWWSDAHEASKAFHEASKVLAENASAVNLDKWQAAYELMQSFDSKKAPSATKSIEIWRSARNEAEEALAKEAGLKLEMRSDDDG